MSTIFNKMSDLKKNRRSGNGSFPQSINLPLEVVEVHVSNTKAPTPATDYVKATLMIPAFNLEAGTVVDVRLKQRPPATERDKEPMEVFHLQKGKRKGTGAPAGERPQFIAEDAVMQSDGTIECNWIKIAVHEAAETADGEWLHVGEMISVGYLENQEGKSPKQNRDLHWVSSARQIVSQEDGSDAMTFFKDVVTDMLQDRTELASGRPMVTIRLINNNELGQESFVQAATISRRWDNDNKVWKSAEESLAMWLADQDNADWVEFIAAGDELSAANGTLEIWPTWRYRTGIKALERDIKRESEGKTASLPAGHFSAPKLSLTGEIVRDDNGKARSDWGLLAEGSLQAVRPQNFEDFIANATWTRERFPSRLHTTEDVVTPNLPAETAAHFVARGEKRVELKRESRKEQKAASAPAEDQQQGQDFDGAPDPQAGMGGFRPK
jgi:hypothetical protein